MDVRTVTFPPIPLKASFSVVDLFHIFAYRFSPTYVYPGDRHEPWELVYIQSGEVVVTTEDFETVMSAGHIILHKPNEPHKIRSNHVACKAIVLLFSVDNNDALLPIADTILSADQAVDIYIKNIMCYGIPILTAHTLKNSSLSTLNQMPAIPYASAQVLKNSLELLLIDLIQSVDPNYREQINFSSSNIDNNNVIVLGIIDYLSHNINNKVSLSDIARSMGYSVSSITSCFKRNTGESIMDYFTKMKVNKACSLLAESDYPMEQISSMLNFSNTQYFCTTFKKVTGCTPQHFRKQQKESSGNVIKYRSV